MQNMSQLVDLCYELITFETDFQHLFLFVQQSKIAFCVHCMSAAKMILMNSNEL